jgi:UDPglucose 6-dehydrogenase
MKPDRIVVGANDDRTLDNVESLFKLIGAPVLRMDLRSAEMTKHALNAFLATCVSFGNEIGNICERVGADALKVAEALQSDSRIGRKAPLKPGLGFAGGTLARDIKVLTGLSDILGYEAPLVRAVWAVNESQNRSVTTKLERILGSLNDRTVGVLGLTYKPGTSTLRRSAALEIINDLTQSGANVKSFDPKADLQELRGQKTFTFCSSPYDAAESSDALIFITPWPEFKELDFDLLKSKMRQPAVVIDTQNMLNGEQLATKGFSYFGTGRGKGKQNTAVGIWSQR